MTTLPMADAARNNKIKAQAIGLSFACGKDFIRVWGYLPECFEQFETINSMY
jgi:hypothetical protein